MARPPYTVDQVISRGYYIINNIHPRYSQGRPSDPGPRGTSLTSPFQDCSSFMGVINGVGTPATPAMLSVYSGYGYIPIVYNIGTPLKKGDVLFYDRGGGSNGHTVLYIGNGQIMHMTSPTACVTSFYNPPRVGKWDDILRNPNSGLYPVHWTPYEAGWSTPKKQ